MAIWPFGRKNKRHTIQIGASDAVDIQTYDAETSFDDVQVGRKPSRKSSKRQKNRHSPHVQNPSSAFEDEISQPVAKPHSQPTLHREPAYSIKESRDMKSRTERAVGPFDSRPSVSHTQQPLSRNGSMLKSKRPDNGPMVLKKKLSKWKAYEISREQEIRLMASSPIDIPRRSTTLPAERFSIETRRAPRAQSQRSNRHLSDLSLPVRDSAASSISESSEPYTFKVNSFAAWTPRPIIRYVEPPRISTARSQRSTEAMNGRENMLNLSLLEESLNSKQRVDALADSLDASALRELLERDRRRKEKQKLEEQEKMRRRLQRRAEKQRMGEEKNTHQEHQFEDKSRPGTIRDRPTGDQEVESAFTDNNILKNDETKTFLSGDTQSGSWLRDASKERSGHVSLESVHIMNNLDDSSLRRHKLNERPSFTPSHDMGLSHTTLSPSHSLSRRGLGSPTPSQVYGLARESMSDVSRTVESERRLSDNSSTRGNTLTSLFRRGSSRLKRRYRERFHDQASESVNLSNESFFKVSTQSSGPPPYVPPKPFLRSGTIKRSQSKFTEHFGDEPLSPPDSRLQSPDIPEEEILDQVGEATDKPDLNEESQYPILGSESDLQDTTKITHRSWGADSLESDVDNVPLSQSLASIDSEGSWMSGQFLRRISQKKSNPIRHSISFSQVDSERADSPRGDEIPAREPCVRFDSYRDSTAGPSQSVAEEEDETDTTVAGAPPQDETWHSELAKRPIVVNPTMRPKSTEGLLLRSIQSLSRISADEEVSPIEEHPSEHQYADHSTYGRAY